MAARTTKQEKMKARKELADSYPMEGVARAKQNAAYLAMSESNFWRKVKEGEIKQGRRLGSRTTVWDVSYIRELARNGIPAAGEVA